MSDQESNQENTEDAVDEYDDYQHEISNEMANDFIEEEIFPLLDEFDYNNENSDYIPGIATFCLFAKLCIQLMGEGYSVEELKSVVDDFSIYCVDDVVH
jgi:hypothetical protein